MKPMPPVTTATRRMGSPSAIEFCGEPGEHAHPLAWERECAERALAAVGSARVMVIGKSLASLLASSLSERDLPADLVLLAMGFTGAERGPLMTDLGVELDARGNVARDGSYATSVPGVFVAGDMGRGQSLIVWAIAEGRSAAAGLDRYLSGDTVLPVAIPPTARPMA